MSERCQSWVRQGIVAVEKSEDGLLHSERVRQRKIDERFEAPPHCGIKQARVVSRSNEEASRRPLVDLLKKDRDKSLQFADFGRIVTPLCDRVELIEKQYAGDRLSVVQHISKVG